MILIEGANGIELEQGVFNELRLPIVLSARLPEDGSIQVRVLRRKEP